MQARAANPRTWKSIHMWAILKNLVPRAAVGSAALAGKFRVPAAHVEERGPT